MKYTKATVKAELINAANDLQNQRTVLFWLLFASLAWGILF